MKIKSVEIKNYKAFHGTHKINIGQKNVFIYGENGSGKSSFYYALKDFVQSSMEDFSIDELENVFVAEAKKGSASIKVHLAPDKDGNGRGKNYEVSNLKNDTKTVGDSSIKDSYQLKSFLTYKHLLDIHHLKKDDEINLFNLLVHGVLKHFKYSLTGGKELGVMYQDIQTILAKETGRDYNSTQKARDLKNNIDGFNNAFGQLFKEPITGAPNPEYILTHAHPILDDFGHNITIKLHFTGLRTNADNTAIVNNKVGIELQYAGKTIDKPHLLLNEARLSAIAISIYLGMIKRHPQAKPFKLLFLDDIFIGLDISNRLPLLTILDNHFSDYQVFITTYDKPWYEYVRAFLDLATWRTIEFYAQEVKGGFEIPLINDQTDFIKKAKKHYTNADYKAAAVYARSAFEELLMNYCADKRKKLPFKKKRKEYSSEDFWKVVKLDLSATMVSKIEQYRFLIYNPLSHFDPEVNPIKSELKDAIDEMVNLKVELAAVI